MKRWLWLAGIPTRVAGAHGRARAACGGRELFIRKDFPQGVGVAVVLIAGLCSLYFLRTNFMLAYGILGAAIVVDFIFYLIVGKVTTCSACRAEYRT